MENEPLSSNSHKSACYEHGVENFKRRRKDKRLLRRIGNPILNM
jgi:hypothetical protein